MSTPYTLPNVRNGADNQLIKIQLFLPLTDTHNKKHGVFPSFVSFIPKQSAAPQQPDYPPGMPADTP